MFPEWEICHSTHLAWKPNSFTQNIFITPNFLGCLSCVPHAKYLTGIGTLLFFKGLVKRIPRVKLKTTIKDRWTQQFHKLTVATKNVQTLPSIVVCPYRQVKRLQISVVHSIWFDSHHIGNYRYVQIPRYNSANNVCGNDIQPTQKTLGKIFCHQYRHFCHTVHG